MEYAHSVMNKFELNNKTIVSTSFPCFLRGAESKPWIEAATFGQDERDSDRDIATLMETNE